MENNIRYECLLSEVCSNITDGKHGDCKNETDSGYYFVSVKDVYNGKINYENARQIEAKDFEETHKRTKLEANDILVTNTGTIGRMAFIKNDSRVERTTFQKSVAVIKAIESKVIPKYLYYYIINEIERLKGFAGGTTQKNLLLKDLRNFKIKIPNKNIQFKIQSILSTLDDRIELNNEMNKTLEEIAQAIFKSCFVDFEPFKDDGFEESESGIIPKGWNITELSELGDIITGKTPSKNNLEFFGNKYKFITPKDINKNMFITKTERGLSEDGYNKMKKNKHIKYSIGVSCIGSDLGEVYINDEDGFTNQQINTLTLNNYKYYPYVYIYLKNMKNEFKSMASGSAVPIINKTTFSNIKIILPSEKYIEDFYNKINSMFDKILININQNEELKAMRDTLLPKLISGEINI